MFRVLSSRNRRRVAALLMLGGLVRMAPAAETKPNAVPLGPPGTRAVYRPVALAPVRSNTVQRLFITLGPAERRDRQPFQWIQLEAVKANGQRFRVWCQVDRPMSPSLLHTPGAIARYLFQPEAGRPLEYVDRVTGAAVLPDLGAETFLVPSVVAGGWRDGVVADRIRWLGHPYELEGQDRVAGAASPASVRRLELRRDALIGVPSNLRTRDNVRRYDGSDYPMRRLTREDYAEMIGAGMNCLRVDPEQAGWIQDEPVYYWGVGAGEVAFPECLFRSNYRGPALFLDEPAVGTRDSVVRPRLAKEPGLRRSLSPQFMLKAFSEHFRHAVREGAPTVFSRGLRAHPDLDPGELSFPQRNLFSWETMIASAAWQMTRETDGGPRAIVFEPPGRLGLRRTLPEMNMVYGCQLPTLAAENFYNIIIGFLRGAARASGGQWGVSIYGAVDRADGPWLLKRAYDLGAQRFFFWDNYQLACVPFAECLELSRQLKAHADRSPPRDHSRLREAARSVVLLPPGYDLGHVFMGRGIMWGLGELNLERTNRLGVAYRTVLASFFTEIERCQRLRVPYDLLWDLDGLNLAGYREIVRVREDGQVEVITTSGRVLHASARPPPRPGGAPPELTLEPVQKSGSRPWLLRAQARVRQRAAPVYYTTGADDHGVAHNVYVLWELYGPDAADYRALSSPQLRPKVEVEAAGRSASVEIEFRVSSPGLYRLRAATTDLDGRSTVVWQRVEVRDGGML